MRYPVHIVSDLHLMDREEIFLFNAEKEAQFCLLAERVLAGTGSLVLAGDIFDFTGMTPCQIDHRLFFTEALNSRLINVDLVERVSTYRTTEQLLSAVSAAFPNFMKMLSRLAKAGQLTFIPGNHDCDFLTRAGQRCLEQALGVSESAIDWQLTIETETLLIAAHGNQFDAQNNTSRGCRNPGFVFTSALYQGVLPALSMLGVPVIVIAALPAVRPEEAVIEGLAHHLDKEQMSRLLIALARLLQRNHFFQGPAAVPAWLLTHDVPVLSKLFRRGVTPARIRALLPKEEGLILGARKGAERLRAAAAKSAQKKLIQQTNAAHNEKPSSESRARPRKKLVVLGHTHELDTLPDYVNLGTWLDHLTGLSPEHIERAERSLPVLELSEEGRAVLYDARQIGTLCDSKQKNGIIWERSAQEEGF
jgi:UDP-2,3-diacylglucosamine pyrophosphatase LpxH